MTDKNNTWQTDMPTHFKLVLFPLTAILMTEFIPPTLMTPKMMTTIIPHNIIVPWRTSVHITALIPP